MKVFFIYLKRCLYFKSFIFVLLIMPIIAIIFSLFGKNVIGEIKFGVYADNKYGTIICNKLKQEQDFKFILYDDLKKLSYDVSMCEIDSGYVFNSDFENAVKSLDFKNSIKIIKSNSSSGYNFGNQIVISKIVELVSPLVSDLFLKNIGVNETSKKYYDDILNKLDSICFNYIDFGDEKFNQISIKFEDFFASLVLIGSVLSVFVCIKDKERNIVKGNFICVFSFAFLLEISSMIALLICNEFNMYILFKGIIFMFVSAIFAYLFSFIKNKFILYGCLPIIMICIFSVSLMEFNFGIMSYVFNIIKWLIPVGLYRNSEIIEMIIYCCVMGFLYNIKEICMLKNKFFE